MALRAKNPKAAKQKKPKMLIAGPPGVGKTWGAMGFPNAYLIDCEGGATLSHYTDKLAKSGGVYMGPEDGANDFAVVVAEVRSLATTTHHYKTLIIDSYSKLFNTKVSDKAEAMEKAGSDMDKTFGREKKPAISYTRQMISWFDRLDMNVLLICHEKDVWEDGKVVGKSYDGWDKLAYELDFTLQIFKQGTSRKARVGKCRLSQFKEGEVFDWNYETFASRYGKDVIEADHQAVAPATAEQVELVRGLAGLYKLDDETKVKWFEKAGVETWAEMDGATIQKCIDHLKSLQPTAA